MGAVLRFWRQTNPAQVRHEVPTNATDGELNCLGHQVVDPALDSLYQTLHLI